MKINEFLDDLIFVLILLIILVVVSMGMYTEIIIAQAKAQAILNQKIEQNVKP